MKRSSPFAVSMLAAVVVFAACQEDLTNEKAKWDSIQKEWAGKVEKTKKGQAELADQDGRQRDQEKLLVEPEFRARKESRQNERRRKGQSDRDQPSHHQRAGLPKTPLESRAPFAHVHSITRP